MLVRIPQQDVIISLNLTLIKDDLRKDGGIKLRAHGILTLPLFILYHH